MAIDNNTIVKAYKRYAEYYNFYFGRIGEKLFYFTAVNGLEDPTLTSSTFFYN